MWPAVWSTAHFMRRQGSADSGRTHDEFLRQLRAGKVSTLYLFEGEESLLRDEALTQLIDHEVDSTVRDFNVSALTVTGGDLGVALEVARQLPMIASRRVVIVSGFEAVSDEKQLESLQRYLDAPNPSSVVVFASQGLDNRRVIAGMLRRACVLVSFKRSDDSQSTPTWVAEYVARKGSTIGPAEAGHLVGVVGTDLRRLASEADKLMTFVGEGGRITREQINGLVRYSREHSNFDLSDAIRDGDRERALRLIDHLFAEKVEAPMVLGAIGSVFRRMLAAKELMAQGATNEEVAKAVGMTPYRAGRFNERVRRVDTAHLLRGLERIAETDIALKSSLATPRLQLEMLVCELCPAENSQRR